VMILPGTDLRRWNSCGVRIPLSSNRSNYCSGRCSSSRNREHPQHNKPWHLTVISGRLLSECLTTRAGVLCCRGGGSSSCAQCGAA
jgi:hypothetical protein